MTIDAEKVKSYWEGQARDQTIPVEAVTHSDVWQRWLEMEMIRDHLKPTDRVLDVGCGNGYTTKQIAPLVGEIVGIDYSDEMIHRAVTGEPVGQAKCEASPQFRVQNVLDLDPSSLGLFDVVLSERCLINLTSWDDQKRALANISSVVKPGGRFIFVEGCKQGRERLDELRQAVGLDKMPDVWHNLDFDEQDTLAYLRRFFTVEHRAHLGVYDFISRVVHPLMVAPEQPCYDSKYNKIAAELCRISQEFKDLSRVLFLVLQRTGERKR